MDNSSFLPHKGYYRKLKSFQIATCIYDITVYFANKYLEKSSRTIDQMIQAARSGRQNIAEGSAASETSKETELKLTNVARASLQELLLDYEDYLRQNSLELWAEHDYRTIQTRTVCKTHNDSEFYLKAIAVRSPETIANIAIVLIHQADFMLCRLIERQKQDFLEKGGIREQMATARTQYRKGK